MNKKSAETKLGEKWERQLGKENQIPRFVRAKIVGSRNLQTEERKCNEAT